MAVFGENTIRVFFATIQQVQLVDWAVHGPQKMMFYEDTRTDKNVN